jgi:cyclopropane-fatty-acyl-phospholipid synthase
MRIAERIVKKVLEQAEIEVNGNAPWDIKVNNQQFYTRVLEQGSLGLGESYMDGWWDCQHLDQFFDRVLQNDIPWFVILNLISVARFFKSKLVNLTPKSKSFDIGKKHYDLGNSLFQAMLDRTTMSYSCGYWKNASTLNEAQKAKLDLICCKLWLQPGQRVLDIGCGWGGFAHYAATHYNAEVVGLTVSKEQVVLARERCKDLPVEIRLQDYRDVNEQFDHIVSVGMFEHVGPKNYLTYMRVVEKCLRPGGMFLLHTIGSRDKFFCSMDPWIGKYIFPLAELPMRQQILRSSQGLLQVRDWHEFGKYYDPTLMAWHKRFVEAWGKFQAEYGHKVGGRFHRMWEYYLLACAGSFRARNIELWQVVLAHPGQGEYRIVR